jgi:tRNA(fMet)-specific endonuclease VapC
MRYLFDTNHWSLLQRGDPHVVRRVSALPDGAEILMPVVVQAELLAGVLLSPMGRRQDELRRLYVEAVQDATRILEIDSRVAERFASIIVQLRGDGRPIGTNDIWIAAIALAHDVTVVSGDLDFRHVRGLRVEDWSQG